MAYGAGGGEAAGGSEAWGRGISQVLGEIPLSPLASAFQSPKRSSASGSAPRDSTRRVRSSELVPPPPTTMGLGLVLGLAWGLLAPGPQEAPWGGGVSGLAPSPGSRFLPPR